MAGPWEKYQKPGGDGPWTKFQPAEPEPSTGYGEQAFSGLLEGATSALGAPVDLMNNFVVAPAMSGINAVFGTDLQPSAEPLGGSAGLRRGLAIAEPSDDAGQQIARRVSQSVGSAAVPLSTSKTVAEALMGLGTAVGGGVGGATAQQLFPGNPTAEIIGELVGGGGTGIALAAGSKRNAQRAAENAVPSVDELKRLASDKYDEAERLGVKASNPETAKLAADIRNTAATEGLISPTGRISEAYPKAREAVRLLDDYAIGDMTVPQMKTVRKVLSDAAQSVDGSERRIATMMLKQFDDFISPLAPQIAEGNAFYTKAMRGNELETLSDLASSRAGQFSGSGYENALRTEYRGLERKIIKGDEKGWSPEQADAISRVAQGTTGSNIARNIGKAAPTGPVSFAASAGIPFMIGNAIGGPAMGATLATAASGIGYGARGIATKMGGRNAEIAELLARNGGPVNSRGAEGIRGIIAALLAEQASNQGDGPHR